jgi:oligoendopeptidase F
MRSIRLRQSLLFSSMKLLHCLTLGMAVCCNAAGADDESLVARLNAKEDQLEKLYADYWRADWEAAQSRGKANTAAIRSRIRSATIDSALLSALTATRFRDPVRERRRELYLQECAADAVEDDAELARVVESISRQQSRIRFRVGDRRLTRAQLEARLATDANRARRRTAWEAQAQTTATFGGSLKQAIRLRNSLSLRHNGTGYADSSLARKGLSRAALLRWFDELRTGTEAEYQSLLNRARQKLGVERVEPWDLDYYIGTLSSDAERKLFTTEEAWNKIKKFALSLSIDFGGLPVEMKTTDLAFGGATYPILYGREVKMLVNRDHGVRFTETLLHESGHALHYCLDQEPSFLLRAGYSEAFDEGLGQVMALMLYDPAIATSYFGITAAQAAAFRDRQRLRSLVELREYLADSMFELTAYDNPDQDLSRAYNDIYSQYLRVDMHGREVWAYDPFYGTDPIYLQNYVLADMMARQVHRYLHDHFGDVWGSEAGAFLKDKLYSRGGRFTLNEILEQSTGHGLTSEFLITALRP